MFRTRPARWFEALWDDSEAFEAHLMRELRQAWPLAQVTPYQVYLKTLYELARDRNWPLRELRREVRTLETGDWDRDRRTVTRAELIGIIRPLPKDFWLTFRTTPICQRLCSERRRMASLRLACCR